MTDIWTANEILILAAVGIQTLDPAPGDADDIVKLDLRGEFTDHIRYLVRYDGCVIESARTDTDPANQLAAKSPQHQTHTVTVTLIARPGGGYVALSAQQSAINKLPLKLNSLSFDGGRALISWRWGDRGAVEFLGTAETQRLKIEQTLIASAISTS